MPYHETPRKPTADSDWVWDPYGEVYDLQVKTIEDMEAANDAARELSTIIDGMPGWLVEAAGLDKALSILDNVTVKEGETIIDFGPMPEQTLEGINS